MDNLRRTKTVNGTTTGFIWNGSNMVAETDGTSIQKIHNYTLDGIAMITQNNEDNFYIKNGHGDVITISDAIGNYMNYHSYDAFGNELSLNPYYTDTFRYAGEYFDTETELLYLRNRYYNASNGRFITEDPIKDGLNWYAYCGGNPVIFTDPMGLFEKDTILKKGIYDNADVKELQKRLNSLGFVGEDGKKLVEDGDFGSNTEYAVRMYQEQNGLKVDGIVGENTWSSLGLIFSQSLPKQGEPNSTGKLFNPDGSTKQERKYDSNGDAEYDDDYNHPGDGHGIGFPHRHHWENGVRAKEPVPVPKAEKSSNNGWGVMLLAGVITIIEFASWGYGMPIDIPGN